VRLSLLRRLGRDGWRSDHSEARWPRFPAGDLLATGSTYAGAEFPCGSSSPTHRTRGNATASSPGTSERGSYGDVTLDGLNVVAVGSFEGSIWTGEANRRWGSSSTSAPTSASARRSRDLRRAGRQLARRLRRADRRRARHRARPDRLRDRRPPRPLARGSPPEGQGQRRGSHRADRSKGAPVPVDNAPARRSAHARSPHGPPPRRTRWRHSASSGAGRPLKQALPFDWSGPDER
jgi:hypothetical protein